ncbi:hypothetical protein GCM10009734_09130 [Nonomuraea bangladeshensis]
MLQDHYKPGQALPGEAFLANEYATSRPTTRKAIAQLVGEGLLTVAHGRGTFVRPTPDRRLILLGAAEREDLLSPAYDPSRQGWEHVTVPSDAERADSRLGPNMPIFMSIEGSTAAILIGVHAQDAAAPLPVLGPGGPALRVGLPQDTRVAVVCCAAGKYYSNAASRSLSRLTQPDRPVRRHTVELQRWPSTTVFRFTRNQGLISARVDSLEASRREQP